MEKQVPVDIVAQFHTYIGMRQRGLCIQSIWRWATSAETAELW